MNDENAKRQINAMISFIMQEAKEKADDIKKNTENEFSVDKLSRERNLNLVVREEFARKRKERLTSKKIERSRKATEVRIKKMRERDNIIKNLREEIVDKLADVSKNTRYSDLIKFLIVQGLMTIAENRVTLRCRKEDLNIVNGQLAPAIKQYQDFIKQNTGIAPNCKIDVSNDYLSPGPSKNKTEKAASCCGGIILSARNGTIVCKNTLDSRLDLCFDNLIPQIRGILFGVREKPVVKDQIQTSHH